MKRELVAFVTSYKEAVDESICAVMILECMNKLFNLCQQVYELKSFNNVEKPLVFWPEDSECDPDGSAVEPNLDGQRFKFHWLH